MNRKIKMNRMELKRQRNLLERYEHYLPTLKLKEQQLQYAIFQKRREHREIKGIADKWGESISGYRAVFHDLAGINLGVLSQPEDVKIGLKNIAGVNIPIFESAVFPEARYSLFGTPPWVDQALIDLREQNLNLVKLKIATQQLGLLQAEQKKIMQRVNLFEKIIIPEARENIRRIRIVLGDRMTAAVARAKMAKEKLQQRKGRERIGAGPI
jgi:V/A-type H+-transporting ATPase subunit D